MVLMVLMVFIHGIMKSYFNNFCPQIHHSCRLLRLLPNRRRLSWNLSMLLSPPLVAAAASEITQVILASPNLIGTKSPIFDEGFHPDRPSHHLWPSKQTLQQLHPNQWNPKCKRWQWKQKRFCWHWPRSTASLRYLRWFHLRYRNDAVVFEPQITKSSGHRKAWVVFAFDENAMGHFFKRDLSSCSFNSCLFFVVLRFAVFRCKNQPPFLWPNHASAVAKVRCPDFVAISTAQLVLCCRFRQCPSCSPLHSKPGPPETFQMHLNACSMQSSSILPRLVNASGTMVPGSAQSWWTHKGHARRGQRPPSKVDGLCSQSPSTFEGGHRPVALVGWIVRLGSLWTLLTRNKMWWVQGYFTDSEFLALIPHPVGFSDEAAAVTYDLVLEGLVQNLLWDSQFLHLRFVPFSAHTMPPERRQRIEGNACQEKREEW